MAFFVNPEGTRQTANMTAIKNNDVYAALIALTPGSTNLTIPSPLRQTEYNMVFNINSSAI